MSNFGKNYCRDNPQKCTLVVDPRLFNPHPIYRAGSSTVSQPRAFSNQANLVSRSSGGIKIKGQVDVQRQPSQTGKILDIQFPTGWNPAAFDKAFADLNDIRKNVSDNQNNFVDSGSAVSSSAIPPDYSAPVETQISTEQAQVPKTVVSDQVKPESSVPWGWLVAAAIAGLLLARGQRGRAA